MLPLPRPKPRETKFVPWRVSSPVIVLRRLNVSWLLFYNSEYQTVQEMVKKTKQVEIFESHCLAFCFSPTCSCLRNFFFLIILFFILCLLSPFSIKHKSGWRKWGSAMHAEIPNTEMFQWYCAQHLISKVTTSPWTLFTDWYENPGVGYHVPE